MTTSVRFCLSYDRFKLDFIVFKVDIISIEHATLSRTLLWRHTYAPKCYVTCGHTICMTWRYPLNNIVIYDNRNYYIAINIKWLELSDKSRGTMMTIFLDIGTQYQNCTLSLAFGTPRPIPWIRPRMYHAGFHDDVMGNHANAITSLNCSETNGYNTPR